MSDVWCLMTNVWQQRSHDRGMMSDVWCQMSDDRCLKKDVWYQRSDDRCQTSDVRCVMTDVWCQTSDHDGLRLQKKFWPGGLLISYITCHRLPETINEAFFFSQHLVSFVRFTEVVACEYFAKVSVALLHNAGCICQAMSKMARFLITPGKC